MTLQIQFFTQPGCLSCELMRLFLEAHELTFEDHDISADPESRRIMMEELDSDQTPTLLIISGETHHIIVGFDPEELDRVLNSIPSSDSVTGS